MDFKSIFDKIADDYESLLESGNMSDVTLVAGDKELKLHKVILSSRSPVFDAMFSHDSTEEAQENRVEITDVDLEVLELLVRYIYTGKVKMLKEYVVDLLFAAEKYQLKCLKSVCEQQLMSQISIESISDLLIFADNYQITELYRKCRDYITNNGTKVIASEGWNKVVLKVDLLAKLYEHLYFEYSKEVNDYDKKIETKKREANCGINCLFGLDLIFENQYVLNCNEEMTDVILVAGDVDIKVHKLVLASQSPVFAGMFAHDPTKEEQENRVKISDVNADVLKVLIKYIYSGKVDKLDWQAAVQLLMAAEKYRLDCPESLCEQLLSNLITIKSVSDLLIYADMHQDNELYNKCVDYIGSNLTQVMATVGWKKILLRTDLLAKIRGFLNLDSSEQLLSQIKIKYDPNLSILTDGTAQPDCLKSICEQRLLSEVISTKSVSDLIIFADMHQDAKLYNKCVEFIGFNLTHVIATVGWKKILVRADLLAKICKLLDLDFSELLLSPITIDSVSNLSFLADQPECRKSAFEQQLLSHISTESVSNLLIFADMHQLTELFTRCLYYIIDNGTEVMASIGWERILVRADLLAKIYEHLSLKYTRVMDDKRNAQDKYDYDYYETRNHDSDNDYYDFMW